jgi:DNA-binding NarL/FixJ family response regulator
VTISGKAEVLLVEDSGPVARRLTAMLRDLGTVGAARHVMSAASARSFFPLMRPDVVILDIALPDGSGIELAADFKRERPECLVVMLTNNSTEAYRRASRDAGADYFFDKTTEIDSVAEVFRRLHPPHSEG